MKTRNPFALTLLAAMTVMLASGIARSKTKNYFTETGTLTEMQAVPCGSRARGFTGIGGLLATAGVEDVNSKDKLCQEYVLKTGYVEYRIRPIDEKNPSLLPVGEKSHFRIVKDRVLLTVPDGDDKVREYKVVGMKPLIADDDAVKTVAVKSEHTPQLERRDAGDESTKTEVRASDSGSSPSKLVQSGQVPTDPNPPRSLAGSGTATSDPGADPQRGRLAESLPPESEPDSAAKAPLTRAQVMGLVSGGVASSRVAVLVKQRGVSFQPTPEFLADLKSVGATDELLNTLSQSRAPAASTSSQAAPAPPPVVPNNPGQLQQLKQAEQQDRAAELARPGDPSVHVALADALGQEGKWSEAAAQYTAVISDHPDDATAHSDLGLALRRSGDIDGAIREYRRALAIDPSRAGIHDNLGVALSQKGDLDGAVAEFREAIRLDPASAQAHNNLGSMLEQRNDEDGAVSEYRKSITLGGGPSIQYNLATALERKGDNNGAVAAFRQALAANPNDASMHAALAGALQRSGDRDGALREYAVAIKLAPQDATIRANYDRLAKGSMAQNSVPM